MAKKRQESPPSEGVKPAKSERPRKQQKAAGGITWHPAWRVLVSFLVVFHLLAVFVAPWAMMSRSVLPPNYVPPADSLGRPLPIPREVFHEPVVVRSLQSLFNDYLNMLFLNHGYEFFAPNPPAVSHVIEYQITKLDGTTVEGRFPDLSDHWPRLLYHRHMMLADQLVLVNDIIQDIAESTGKRLPFSSGQLYAEHLATLHDGNASLKINIHKILSTKDVLSGMKLDDEQTYVPMNTISARPKPDNNKISSDIQLKEAPIAIPRDSQ